MENAVQIRGATAQDAQVFFALNLAFNGEGVASPQEAALALAHPGPERVLLAFVAGEPAGFLCGLLKRSAWLLSALRRGDGAVRLPRLPPPGQWPGSCWRLSWTPAATRAVEAVTVLTGEDNAPRPGPVPKNGFSPSGEAHFDRV